MIPEIYLILSGVLIVIGLCVIAYSLGSNSSNNAKDSTSKSEKDSTAFQRVEDTLFNSLNSVKSHPIKSLLKVFALIWIFRKLYEIVFHKKIDLNFAGLKDFIFSKKAQ